ncbi:MAG TPA: TRAFs-binding domain-containing protein [Candidatus Binatia bacterium]|nr:TRAFs-binding domain-containing protein [Candidatus Binatia bacterium]
MAADNYQIMKAACARITAGKNKGTGYLVDCRRIVTCAHVVKPVLDGGKVTATFAMADLEATVTALDEISDAAVLTLANPADGITPLELAGGCARKAPWEGYGFPELTKGEGIPLEGAVMDPDSKDDQKIPTLLLRSEQIAAGEGASLHGFSGSPVLVQGFVIGHLKRYIKDKESPLRPAYGYVYATPSAAVLKLLQAEAAVPVIEPPSPLFPAAALHHARNDQYDVFISYRSTDSKWATALLNRLEGVGFKVYIDQRNLLPGEPLANALQAALARSKAAVVLLSKGWLESSWCQEEANVLLHRTVEDPSFRVIPVRIDDCKLPPIWNSRTWLDFSHATSPEGPAFRKLQFALLGRTPPPEEAVETRVFKAETDATDELLRDIRAAAAAGAPRVYRLWTKWSEAQMPDGPASLHVAQTLVGLGRPDQALEVLNHARPGDRADQLRALALAKSDKLDESIEILRKLYDAKKTEIDAETGGILAGRYKQRWLARGSTHTLDLRAAFEIYRETFERTKDSYPGINAAAMALELGDRAESGRIAQKILLSLEGARTDELDHWKLATIGEAYLLSSDLENAKKWYGKAVSSCPERHQDIAVMRRQARRNLQKLGLQRDSLDGVLQVPGVAAFTGHMVDAPGRPTPRFPQEKVGIVRNAIAERLKKHQIGYGFSSAARGSDLVFIEELKKTGGCSRVFLPFPREQFKLTSVGYGWDGRFDKALRDVEVIELSSEVPPEDKQPDAYSACNAKIIEEAIAKAKLLDEQPILITVWNGNPGDGVGGTADAVHAWRDEGYTVEQIDISKL